VTKVAANTTSHFKWVLVAVVLVTVLSLVLAGVMVVFAPNNAGSADLRGICLEIAKDGTICVISLAGGKALN
jgi:hypothetical protein